MKIKILIIIALTLISSTTGLTASAELVLAADESTTTVPTIPQPTYQPGPSQESLPSDDLKERSAIAQDKLLLTIARFIDGFIGMIASLAVLMLIVSGIQMLVAFGEEEKITNAKKTATWAILGLVIAIFAFAIVRIINTLPISEPDIPAAEDSAT